MASSPIRSPPRIVRVSDLKRKHTAIVNKSLGIVENEEEKRKEEEQSSSWQAGEVQSKRARRRGSLRETVTQSFFRLHATGWLAHQHQARDALRDHLRRVVCKTAPDARGVVPVGPNMLVVSVFPGFTVHRITQHRNKDGPDGLTIERMQPKRALVSPREVGGPEVLSFDVGGSQGRFVTVVGRDDTNPSAAQSGRVFEVNTFSVAVAAGTKAEPRNHGEERKEQRVVEHDALSRRLEFEQHTTGTVTLPGPRFYHEPQTFGEPWDYTPPAEPVALADFGWLKTHPGLAPWLDVLSRDDPKAKDCTMYRSSHPLPERVARGFFPTPPERHARLRDALTRDEDIDLTCYEDDAKLSEEAHDDDDGGPDVLETPVITWPYNASVLSTCVVEDIGAMSLESEQLAKLTRAGPHLWYTCGEINSVGIVVRTTCASYALPDPPARPLALTTFVADIVDEAGGDGFEGPMLVGPLSRRMSDREIFQVVSALGGHLLAVVTSHKIWVRDAAPSAAKFFVVYTDQQYSYRLIDAAAYEHVLYVLRDTVPHDAGAGGASTSILELLTIDLLAPLKSSAAVTKSYTRGEPLPPRTRLLVC